MKVKSKMIVFVLATACFLSMVAFPVFADAAKSGPLVENGILIVAHGGHNREEAAWNKNIQELVDKYIGRELGYVNIETIFGHGDLGKIQKAVSILENKNVKRIIAIPLFFSSNISAIRQLAYTLDAKTIVLKEETVYGIVKHIVPIWMGDVEGLRYDIINKPILPDRYIGIWLWKKISEGLDYFGVCGSG